jgi:hypothetical protein
MSNLIEAMSQPLVDRSNETAAPYKKFLGPKIFFQKKKKRFISPLGLHFIVTRQFGFPPL